MNNFNEPLDDIDECVCENCKGLWWVPRYEEIPELGHPSFCTFCGVEFDVVEEI